MDFGTHFGFRVSGETHRSSEGGYKTPVGSALLQGSLVSVDDASPGFLKVAPTNSATEERRLGILTQYLGWDQSIYQNEMGHLDSLSKGVCRANALSVLTAGPGTKIWLKNRASTTRADGRVTSAITMYSTAGTLVAGDLVSWNGTLYTKTGQNSTTVSIARATKVSSTILELVLI